MLLLHIFVCIEIILSTNGMTCATSVECFFQVCDFGLSRLKANTFLSSKSAAGTVSSTSGALSFVNIWHW